MPRHQHSHVMLDCFRSKVVDMFVWLLCSHLFVVRAEEAGMRVPHGMQAKDLQDFCQLETFQAECPADHVILMTSSKYGRMRLDGRCVKRDWGHLGCSVDVLTYLDGMCSGKRSCEMAVADLSGLQPCPADLASFLEVAYKCIKVATRSSQSCQSKSPLLIDHRSVKVFLNHQKQQYSKHSSNTEIDIGYISSTLALDTGLGTALCPWKIRANPGQKINISIFNFVRSTYFSLPPKIGTKLLRQRRNDLGSNPPLLDDRHNNHNNHNNYNHNNYNNYNNNNRKFVRDSKIPDMPPHALFESDRLKSKACHQVVVIREGGSVQREVSICEEGARKSQVHVTRGEEVEIELLPSNLQNVKFLIKFQIIGCPDLFPEQSGNKNHKWKRNDQQAELQCHGRSEKLNFKCSGTIWELEWTPKKHQPSVLEEDSNPKPSSFQLALNLSSLCALFPISSSEKSEHMSSDGWSVSHVFASDYFPYSILMVVSLGVALGVFLGGVLLVCAARVVRSKQRTAMIPTEEFYGEPGCPLNNDAVYDDRNNFDGNNKTPSHQGTIPGYADFNRSARVDQMYQRKQTNIDPPQTCCTSRCNQLAQQDLLKGSRNDQFLSFNCSCFQEPLYKDDKASIKPLAELQSVTELDRSKELSENKMAFDCVSQTSTFKPSSITVIDNNKKLISAFTNGNRLRGP